MKELFSDEDVALMGEGWHKHQCYDCGGYFLCKYGECREAKTRGPCSRCEGMAVMAFKRSVRNAF